MTKYTTVLNRGKATAGALLRARYFLPFALFILLAVYGLSLVIPYSAFRWDSLHWGSILAASIEVCEGRTPYTEVPIYYGPAAFYTFCLMGRPFEFSYLSFGLLTYFSYLTTLFSCGLIGRKLGIGPIAVGLFFITCLGFHPFPLYPWYDYLAGTTFAAGLLCLIYSSGRRGMWLAILGGGLLALTVLFRNSFAPQIVLVALGFLGFRVFSKQDTLGFIAGAVGVTVLFLVAMGIFYRLSPAVIITETLRSYSHISVAFSGFYPFRALTDPSVFSSVQGIFIVCFYLGLLGLGVDLFGPSRWSKSSSIKLICLLSGLVGVSLQHIPEFFRYVCFAPLLILLGYDAIGKSLTALWNVRHREKEMSALAMIASAILLTMAIGLVRPLKSGVHSYPYTTAAFELRDGETLRDWLKSDPITINGIRFYTHEQAEFYQAVFDACLSGTHFANMTSDVMIAAICRHQTPLRHDTLFESVQRQEDMNPDEAKRLTASEFLPGEIGFIYRPFTEVVVATEDVLENPKADFFNMDIVIIRND